MRFIYAALLLFLTGCAWANQYPTTGRSVPGYRRHLLNELLVVCAPPADGAYIYTDCENKQYVIWNRKLPLSVTADPEAVDMTVNAIRVWNEALGFQMFVFVGTFGLYDDPDVYVYVEQNCPSWLLGMAPLIKLADGSTRQMVFTCREPSFSTMLHEFGHVAGLAHDRDNIRSIMHPGGDVRHLPYIESKDIILLRELYN